MGSKKSDKQKTPLPSAADSTHTTGETSVVAVPAVDSPSVEAASHSELAARLEQVASQVAFLVSAFPSAIPSGEEVPSGTQPAGGSVSARARVPPSHGGGGDDDGGDGDDDGGDGGDPSGGAGNDDTKVPGSFPGSSRRVAFTGGVPAAGVDLDSLPTDVYVEYSRFNAAVVPGYDIGPVGANNFTAPHLFDLRHDQTDSILRTGKPVKQGLLHEYRHLACFGWFRAHALQALEALLGEMCAANDTRYLLAIAATANTLRSCEEADRRRLHAIRLSTKPDISDSERLFGRLVEERYFTPRQDSLGSPCLASDWEAFLDERHKQGLISASKAAANASFGRGAGSGGGGGGSSGSGGSSGGSRRSVGRGSSGGGAGSSRAPSGRGSSSGSQERSKDASPKRGGSSNSN